MKILYLNILKGCQEPKRYRRLVDFVKAEAPDICGFCEANGWDENNEDRAKDFSREANFHSYVLGLSPRTKYHTVLFFKNANPYERKRNENFRNAVVEVRLVGKKSLRILLVHFSPYEEDNRMAELKNLLQEDISENTILLGDLNALSPQDNYNQTEVLAGMKTAGIIKFGKDRLRFNVIQNTLDNGFIDAVKKFHPGFEYSVPTAYNRDKEHFTKLRLDYIFVSPDLVKSLQFAEIIRNPETEQLSDHYPVVAGFNL